MGKKHKKNKKHSHSIEPPDFIPYQPELGREMRVVLKLPAEPPPRPSYLEELDVSPSPPPDLHVSIPLAALRKSAVEGGEEEDGGDHRHHHHKHKKHKKKKHHGGQPAGESGGMPQHFSQHSRLDASGGQQDTMRHVTYRQHHGFPVQGDTPATAQQQQLPSFHIRRRHGSGDFLATDVTQHTSHHHHHHHHRDTSPPAWGSAHQEDLSSGAASTSRLLPHTPPEYHKHRPHAAVSEGQATQEQHHGGKHHGNEQYHGNEQHHGSKHHHHHHSLHKKHHKKHHSHPEPEKETQSLHIKIESGVEALQPQPQPHPSDPSPEGLAPPPSQDPLGSGHSHKHHKKKKKHKHSSKSHDALPPTHHSSKSHDALPPTHHPPAATPYSHEPALTVNLKPIYPHTGSATAGKSIDNQMGTASEDFSPSPKRPRTEKPHPYPHQAAKEPKPSQPAHSWPQMKQEASQPAHSWPQMKQEASQPAHSWPQVKQEASLEEEEEDDDEIKRELAVYHQPESRPVAHSGKPRAFTRESNPSFTQETRPKPSIHISQLKYPLAENVAPPRPHPPVVAAPPRPEPVWPRAATPPEREPKPVPLPSSTHPASSSSHLTAPPPKQVVLSKSALRFFLKSLHHQIQRRDPQGIFAEPVTDDIAPGYSKIIHHPMDLSTMGAKVETNSYPSVNEFKDDFVLMCNNAMTYNTPDTLYYTEAKKLLTVGLKVIAKETSMRPDIRHGRVASAPSSATVSPLPLPKFRLPLPTSAQLDYSSPGLCRIDLARLRPHSHAHAQPPPASAVPSPSAFLEQLRTVDVTGMGDAGSQSHLTKVSVGVAEDEGEDSGSEWAEEVLAQAQEAAEAAKENLHTSRPGSRVCFLSRDQEGRTSLSILNPDSLEAPSSKPVDLTALSERVRMGNNAATVLKSELPVCKATPISYLMYGPFGSFAPVYDSAFASLTKTDSDLLLSTYGNELGISYAHSLQQFVKDTGSFVSEMADAVLNGLTNSRHTNFLETRRAKQEREKQLLREASKGKEKSPQAPTEDQVASEGGGGRGTRGEAAGESSPLADGVMPGDGGGVEEGGSVRGDSSEGGSGGGVDETTSVQPEDVDSVSEEESSSMELESNQETGLSEAKQDESLRFEASSVDQHLEHSAVLLSELHQQQLERLGHAPQKSSEGHVVLSGPSEREAVTASKITQELVALTGQVRPRDVVSVEALHQAMGVTVQPTEKPHLPAEQRQNSPEEMLSRQSD